MKKFLCLLLALALALPCAAVGENLSIAELMARQVSANSTFRFLLTADVVGETPFFISADLWNLLKLFAPDTQLEGSYILSKAGETLGNASLNVQLKQGDAVKGDVTLVGSDSAFVLGGSLLGGENIALKRETDILLREKTIPLSAWLSAIARNVVLLGIDADQPGQWPALRSFFTRAATEEETWKLAVDEKLVPYQEELSAWLLSRAKLSLEKREDGSLGTVSRVSASLRDCADEAVSLLRRFYEDSALRDLLRQAMTQQEAESYLEPGMLPLFEEMISALPDDGTMTLERRYTADGAMDAFTLALPFAGGAQALIAWRSGTYTVRFDTGANALEISLSGSESAGYAGTFKLQAGDKVHSGAYQLFVSLGGVVENAANAGRERQQEGTITLLITPDAGMAFPAQSLSVALTASAGASDTQAARWNMSLDWADLGGASSLNLTLKTRTSAAIQQLEMPAATRDFAQMTGEEKAALVQAIVASILAALTPAPV